MRGVKECLNWMLENPLKELAGYDYDGTMCRRRFNDETFKFEWLESCSGRWFELIGFKAYNDMDWSIYNPPVEFHVAYMDCLENNVKYANITNFEKDIINLSIYKNEFGYVFIDSSDYYKNRNDERRLLCISPNYYKWKKVEQ